MCERFAFINNGHFTDQNLGVFWYREACQFSNFIGWLTNDSRVQRTVFQDNVLNSFQLLPVDRLFKGVPVRGLATTLWIRPDPFICEGEIYLLGTVLSHFFALYASINSYHCLKIINTESQEAWEWQEKMGQHALI